MLRKFEVSNFKNFDSNFVFDLVSSKNYEFNPECVRDGAVVNAIVYGPNACGKTNLGYAIFDIKTHLTDEKIQEFYKANYLCAVGKEKHAKFVYTFRFGADEVIYTYAKKSVTELIYETVEINGSTVIALDRRQGTTARIDLAGAETLNRNLASGNVLEVAEPLSVVKYVASSTVLADNQVNRAFKAFISFVKAMIHFTTSETHAIRRAAGSLSPVFLKKEGAIERFEEFLEKAGVKCHLSTMEVDGNEELAFQFGDEKISFCANASMGTLSLAFQYLIVEVLRLQTQAVSKANGDYGKLAATVAEKTLEEVGLWGGSILPFVFIDEFDAFYHYATSLFMVETLKKGNCQFVLTTHNTSIMSNDLMRPDCYFIMSDIDIRPTHTFTDKELRKAHNIEKMFRAGVFNG